MDYKVNLLQSAEEDIVNFVVYLLLEKKSEQAARKLLDDFERIKESLSHVAGSFKGYRRVNFLSHRYFMLYRVEEIWSLDNIFYELQNYENKMN